MPGGTGHGAGEVRCEDRVVASGAEEVLGLRRPSAEDVHQFLAVEGVDQGDTI